MIIEIVNKEPTIRPIEVVIEAWLQAYDPDGIELFVKPKDGSDTDEWSVFTLRVGLDRKLHGYKTSGIEYDNGFIAVDGAGRIEGEV
jgi:hypothetical protein